LSANGAPRPNPSPVDSPAGGRIVAAERERRLNEERHRLLAENARDVIWTMAPDGSITSVSQAVESLRGLTPEEAMVEPIEQTLPPDSLAVSLGYFTQLVEDL
jgi:PAS domain S-box-containing protein